MKKKILILFVLFSCILVFSTVQNAEAYTTKTRYKNKGRTMLVDYYSKKGRHYKTKVYHYGCKRIKGKQVCKWRYVRTDRYPSHPPRPRRPHRPPHPPLPPHP